MSGKTYQINNNNKINLTPNRNNCSEYSINRDDNDKDRLISELKKKIFELEMHEKDYDTLNERYKQLQCEFAALNDCKYHLECQKRLRDDDFNKRVNELQCENENLQIGFNEKLCRNKNVFSHNNILGNQLQLKDSEIFDLNSKINDLESQLNINEGERLNLQKILKGLNDVKNSQNIKISKLIEDNKLLKQICQENDQNIKFGNQERQQMERELDNKNNNIQDLNSQIRTQVNNLNNLQNQINKNNSINMQFQNNLKDYERQIDLLNEENENLRNNLFKEKSVRDGENRKNMQLNNILNDYEYKIEQLNNEIENIKRMQQSVNNNNNNLQEINEKLRNHIMTLTDQNQSLINEIHNVIEEDEKKMSILNRRNRITTLLLNNRNTLDQSLNDLDEYINKWKSFGYDTNCSSGNEY